MMDGWMWHYRLFLTRPGAKRGESLPMIGTRRGGGWNFSFKPTYKIIYIYIFGWLPWMPITGWIVGQWRGRNRIFHHPLFAISSKKEEANSHSCSGRLSFIPLVDKRIRISPRLCQIDLAGLRKADAPMVSRWIRTSMYLIFFLHPLWC